MTADAATAMRCWVCAAADVTPWRGGISPTTVRSHDFRITDARYGTTLPLARCGRCGFVFAPAARTLDLAALYAELEDEEYVRTGAARRLQMRALVRRARRLHPEARTLLDVGAGAGLLVDEARRIGLAAVGVEPSVRLAAQARGDGIPVCTGTLPHPALRDRQFDVVTLIDVLEHVTHPVALLQHCADRLTPGGLLVVVTPDIRSVAARLLRNRWWHFRIAHVGYFSAATLRRGAAAAGLAEAGHSRPVWYLPLSYLVARAGVYLPLGRLTSLARVLGPARRLARAALPVDLRDSLLVAFRHPSSTARHPAAP